MILLNSLRNGIIGSFIASLCCLGPTIIVLTGAAVFFGITGACFNLYKIPFFSLGFVFIFLSGFLYFKRDKSSCNLKYKKTGIYLSTSLIFMLVSYTIIIHYILPYLQLINNNAGICLAI